MTGEPEYEGSRIAAAQATDNPLSKSHIELMNTFNPLVTDPATEAKADYAKIADGWERDVEIFAARIKRSSESAWTGTAATAARQAISDYATDALNFTPALQALSSRVGETVDAVQKTKRDMPPYSDDPQSWWNPGDWFDGNPEKEQEEAAQRLVRDEYVKPITIADGKVPALPLPKNPVTAEELPPGSTGGDPSTGGGNPNTGTPTTQTPQSNTPGTETPDSETPDSETPGTTTPQSSTPRTQIPEATTPQATTPQATTPQATTLGSPSAATPGSGLGGSPGSGLGSGLGTGGVAAPGASLPGTAGGGARAGTGVGVGAGAGAGAGAAGRTGMGGMGGMGSGARGGNNSDDDEHSTPDYLVYDRESELLGTQPPALPPGGVIGA